MNELQIFESSEFGKIRTVKRDNEIWFVGKDVAEALRYSNTKDALIRHVSNEDKKILQRSEITTIENHIPKEVFPVNFVSADVPNRGLTIINESGLYALIFGSKLESARRFKRWVTSEVLPAIRKTGAYGSDNRKWLAELISKTPKENLAYILELYPEYFGDMKIPGSGKDSVEEWISGRGITFEFIRLCPTVTLYADYSGYCDTVGIAKVGKKKFYREIEERFHSSRRQKADGRRYFK